MNFTSLTIIGRLPRRSDGQIQLSIVEALLMFLPFQMGIVDHTIVTRVNATKVTVVVEHLRGGEMLVVIIAKHGMGDKITKSLFCIREEGEV